MSARFTPNWRRYRRWRNALITVWLAWIPAILLTAYLSARFARTPVPIYVAILLWLGAFLFLALRVGNWPCPRCGNRFARRTRHDRRSFLTKRCVHCGLAKYAPGP